MQPPAIEEQRLKSGTGVPRPAVHMAIVIFYVIGGLLNGGSLLRTAEGMEYGSRRREVCVALARPVAAAARVTGLDRSRRWIESMADRWMPGGAAAPPAAR